jgi:malate dehydrogenase (oxaloacetate-decarboxylating)
MDIFEESVEKHESLGGKLEIRSKMPINNRHDLSLAYTPGVARVCEEIAENVDRAYDLTMKKNTVAVVTDGSAVLGLGNIGPEAALPVMEGKAILFKEYADIDAIPICLNTQVTKEIIEAVRLISPTFAGINLEDIAAPRCFEIERKLQDLGIPVFHDDQHGTAITLLGALINAAKLANKKLSELKIVINGAGAAGTAIAEILLKRVGEILVCDREGIISRDSVSIEDNRAKFKLAALTNKQNKNGNLMDAVQGADVLVGVSAANMFTKDHIKSMADKSIVFALANPIPEIMPDIAKEAGAFIVGTGRSDFDNQVNNVLIFPGIFRGAIDARSKTITDRMKIAAAYALAESVKELTVDSILPSVLDKSVAKNVAAAVKKVALEEATL